MKRHYGIAGDNWDQCIPGCVPVRATLPTRTRAQSDGALRLGGVGALVRWKQWHLVVEALAALHAEARSRVRFYHVGAAGNDTDSQRYAAELRALTASRGLSALVEWRGEQPSADALLAGIDCLVVASHNEPFSIAVLEALAAGVPVLAADSGGAGDLLVPEKTGWLFRSGDAASLARGIATLVETDALARVQISSDVVREFTAPVVAARWAEVYAQR
jgi:glycosyltransferase involved in cell wall biosynthesis